MHNEPEIGFFDRSQETQISYGDLPHWFQPNVAVFVTSRTFDSMPASAVLRVDAELRQWLRLNFYPLDDSQPLPDSTELPFPLRSSFRRQKSRLWHGQLDSCHGECALRNPGPAQIVLDSLRHFDGERYDPDCVVIMPNHVHLLVQFRAGFPCTVQCLSWLKFTATRINRSLGRTGHFWQSEPFDHLVRSPEQFQYLRWYIQNNGIRAKLRPDEYTYWNRTLK
jgi:putative transposase